MRTGSTPPRSSSSAKRSTRSLTHAVLTPSTSRPTVSSAWGGHPRHPVTSYRLCRSPTEDVVARLTGGAGYSKVLENGSPDRRGAADRRVTKAVLEVGTAGEAAVIPVLWHASLTARLDRVPDIKEVAQEHPASAASLPIGCGGGLRNFEPELRLRRWSLWLELGVFALAHLRKPATPSSTRWRATPPMRASEEASAGPARAHRGAEECFPEKADTEPELLAQHCIEELRPPGSRWQLAGIQALARSAMAEAVAHLTKGWG